jgi:L-alanine-DL-glutamate epimerase-like enolase superfamily enzyme
MAKTLEKYNIYYIEEPVPTEDKEGSAKLAAATSVPIAGYKTAYTRYEFKDLITKKAKDIVQPDAVWTGGITECMKIAAIASSYSLPVITHCFSSALCLAANLHFVASIPNGELIELDVNKNPFREEIVVEPLNINKDGYIELSSKPGLGIDIKEELLDKYLVNF